MKAMVCTAYGSPDVLQLKGVEKPTPEHNQVLIKVFATTVNIGDCRVRSFDVPLPFWVLYRVTLGLRRLKQPILGAVVAGEIEAVGKSSFLRCKDSLQPSGIYLATDPTLAALLAMLWTSAIGSKKAIWALGPERAQDLEYLTELIEAGKLKAVIDSRYPLEEIAEAHGHVERGHTKGNVVIAVAG